MRKFIQLLILMAFTTAFAKATCLYKNYYCDYGINIEVRGAAFLPLKCDQRQIFGRALPAFQFEISGAVCSDILTCCDQLLVWGNVAWTGKKGRSLGFGYPSRLNLIPLSAGLEYQINWWECFGFYLGLGPAVSFLRIKNSDGFCIARNCRTGGGVMTKTGFRWTVCNHFLIDVFADYYFSSFKNLSNPIQSINHNFSSFFVGGGIGAHF